ncbi:MAG: class I SAM-dependent methyltransferase [Pseudomonadota bacterium]
MRYRTAAQLLRLASATAPTRRLYRLLGNLKNARSGATARIAPKYVFRSEKFLELLRAHGVLREGLEALEIGTGWVHWEALMLRLEVPSETLLYDIWDNRSWERFRAYARQIAAPEMRAALGITGAHAEDLIAAVAAAPDRETAYGLLGFSYQADPTGLLAGIADGSRDLIISSDVGEHLRREDLPEILARTQAVLRPGGWAYHQVVLTDHLGIYAKGTHPKEYLRYSGAEFDGRINNRLQYINRVQIPDWVAGFETAGFEMVAVERIGTCDLSGFPVHSDYSTLPPEDLACTVVQFLVRKA